MSEPRGHQAGLPPELDPRGRRRARAAASGRGSRSAVATARTGLRRTGVVVRALAAVLSLVVLLGSGWAWATYQKFDGDIATGAAPPTSGRDVDGKDQNILLVGNDSRAGATPAELAELSTEDDGGSTNTDTMILMHVPADGRAATLVSFPRDSYVDIPGYGRDRINAAYPDAYNDAKAQGKSETDAESAGLLLTAATISNLTGLHVDHYLQVSLLGFYRISNALGGVEVCLNETNRPAAYEGEEGAGVDAGYENGTWINSYSGIDLTRGVNEITGKQALAFVRQRHGLPNGDLDRVVRQQYFLKAAFAKVKSAGTLLNPFKLNDLLGAVSSSLLKDSDLDLLQLASQVQDLATGNISSVTMVTTGEETIDGKDVLGVDPAAVQAQMAKVIGAGSTSAYDAAKPVAASSVTAAVRNGGGVGGAAAQAADSLRALGFQIPDDAVGDADATAVTTIRYPAGQEAQAKTLAAQVPGAQVAEDSSVQTVTLVLGSDGVTVGAAAAGPSAASSAAGTAPAADAPPAAGNPSTGLGCIN